MILHGIPDFDAAPRGGCTPFLQVSPAPFQHRKTRLLYNSSWQRPVFETYVADDNGIIAFEVRVFRIEMISADDILTSDQLLH